MILDPERPCDACGHRKDHHSGSLIPVSCTWINCPCRLYVEIKKGLDPKHAARLLMEIDRVKRMKGEKQ